MMIPLYHGPRTVCFASFNNICCLAVNFKCEIFLIFILKRTNSDILERNYSFRDVLSGVLEVVQTSIIQHKPPSFPIFPTSTLKKNETLDMSRGCLLMSE